MVVKRRVLQEWQSEGVLSASHSTGEWQNRARVGHCHRNGQIHARDGGSAEATLAICFGYVHVKNRCFHSEHKITAFEMFFGKRINK